MLQVRAKELASSILIKEREFHCTRPIDTKILHLQRHCANIGGYGTLYCLGDPWDHSQGQSSLTKEPWIAHDNCTANSSTWQIRTQLMQRHVPAVVNKFPWTSAFPCTQCAASLFNRRYKGRSLAKHSNYSCLPQPCPRPIKSGLTALPMRQILSLPTLIFSKVVHHHWRLHPL